MIILLQLDDDVVINKFNITDKKTLIGRRVECDITIDDISVSGEHATLEVEDSVEYEGEFNYYINDLGSTNGTFVNEAEAKRQRLKHNDIIRIGWINFKFYDESKEEDTLEKTSKIKKSWIPGVFIGK
ncbi:MAG: FHA domain-containing protein [Gammaproteobacteria bacterium]|nr:FHA domain-containing protein [Gammaproteobacteria bacterium]